MGFQQKLLRSVAKYQRKIQDKIIDHIGTEQKLVRVSLVEDKYGDEDLTVTTNEIITGSINYPDNEIPLAWEMNNSEASANNLHIYDLLPIEGFFKFETELDRGDILLQKVRVGVRGDSTDSTNFRLIALQVVDLITKMTVEVVYKKYQLAPYTLSILEHPELQTIIDEYLAEEWEPTEEEVIDEESTIEEEE